MRSALALFVSSFACGCSPTTLADVQRDVFTPRCANAACHAGESPPHGLDLSEGHAYANTVDVAAVGVEDAVRVVPGDPEESLLFQVTGGPAGVVRQMPVGFTLTDEERDLLRRWIEDGALSE